MAKKKASKKVTEHKPKKRPIEQYDHSDEKRANNPPVGLVTPDTDPESAAKSYRYDPHLDPILGFNTKPSDVDRILVDGIASASPDVSGIEDDAELTTILATALSKARSALEQLKKRRDPYLNWAGKAEHTSFDVPTVSLHVHERIDPKTIIQAVRKLNGDGNGHTHVSGRKQQALLFEQPAENPPIRDAVEFYQHEHNWSNRLIAGDSLLVMNSLLEKEGMAGKVQMVYFDPPYGIRYGSNFQPFVNRREVKDGRDEDLTQEPETIRAFRDTWELGIHSYLTYLRDRLLLARELLNDSGSIFVQISDENLHHVRELMDEIYGAENLVSIITFTKTTAQSADLLPSVCDYLLWYARSKETLKYRPLYEIKQLHGKGGGEYQYVELDDRSVRRLTNDERHNPELLPSEARVFALHPLTSQRPPGDFPVVYEGREFRPKTGYWKTGVDGMQKLIAAERIAVAGSILKYRRYFDDFVGMTRTNIWTDLSSGASVWDPKVYAVQTTPRVIARCMLLSTDPGDLVLDPTCGSGTTAYVAEQWGRRWITCDTSRVAITLAKQRLMTGMFDYFQLAHPDEGVGSGFDYNTVPHVTLKSIANNPEITPGMDRAQIYKAIKKYAKQETLYDDPRADKTKARVTGPFTVEAVPAAAVLSLDEAGPQKPLELDSQRMLHGIDPLDGQRRLESAVARRGETSRQSEWRDELLKTGIRGRGGQRIEFSRVESLGGTRWLHADAETKGEAFQRAVISFGPEHAPLEQKQVARALEEAETLRPKPKLIVFAAFQFDPEAAKDIDETNWPGVMLLKVQMNADMLTDDLKKKRASNDSYWLIGQPDIAIQQLYKGEHTGKWQVEVLGFDYYNTRTGTIESGDTSKIAMWLLDTNYDGRSLYPRQVFFPMAGEKEGWARLAKNLRAEIDEDLVAEYHGTVSLPFEPGDNNRVAVKIIDDRGIESLRILPTL